MTKVFNINLGGLPFTIDEDAYEMLSSYLKTIHNHFRSSEGYEEITTDIEARMAELFQERLGSRQIVSLKDVNGVIAIMGTPEDFGAEPLEAEEPFTSGTKSKQEKKFGIKTGKRLFRNPDEEVIGGVCSGIAAYFGVNDPLWVRLAFILFTFTGGFAVPLYFILWAILPKAETASDKLSMRGEPINASNIGKIIEEEFEHVSRKVAELGDELKEEFGSKKKSTGPQRDDSSSSNAASAGHHVRATISKGIYVLGRILRTVIETLVKIIRPIGFIIGVGLVAMLVLIWIGTVGGLFFGLPFSNFLIPGSPALTTLGAVNILIFLGVPLLMLALGVMRLFMRTNFKPRWTAGLWLFWSLNLVSLMFVGVRTVQDFSNVGEVSLGSNAVAIAPTDTLTIDFEKNPYDDSFLRFGDELMISDNKLINGNIQVKVEKSATNEFQVIHSNFSRGQGISEGQQLASKIDYQYRIEGNHLVLPRFFEIDKGEKWRGQRVNITVKVPEGKWVRPGSNFEWGNVDLDVDDNYAFPWWESQYAWKMGKDGLFNSEFARAHEEKENDLSIYRDFTKIRLEGEIGLDLRQSGEYSVKFSNEHRDDWDGVDLRVDGDLLVISGSPSGRVRLEVTAPNLTELWLHSTEDVTLHDFDLASFKLVNEGESRVDFKGNVNNLDLQLLGDNRTELNGNCNYLKAVLDNEARLDAEQCSVRVADITANNDSWVKISARDTLYQRFDESSNLDSKLKTSVIIKK